MSDGSTNAFERFAFATAYSVEVDPEYPGDGAWPQASFAFDRDGSVVPELVSPWGAPCTLSVVPEAGLAWVGMFPAGGLGSVSGVYATPDPRALCVAVNGLVYLVQTEAPGQGAAIVLGAARQVVAAPKWSLLLFADYSDLVALGPEGIAWRSRGVSVDGLWVTDTEGEEIACSSFAVGERDLNPTVVTIDPETGRVTSVVAAT
jgi:hypothetical protein